MILGQTKKKRQKCHALPSKRFIFPTSLLNQLSPLESTNESIGQHNIFDPCSPSILKRKYGGKKQPSESIGYRSTKIESSSKKNGSITPNPKSTSNKTNHFTRKKIQQKNSFATKKNQHRKVTHVFWLPEGNALEALLHHHVSAVRSPFAVQ